jgi:prepilin-type N-terminal cleavage/methylation domain-containing protein
MHSKGFSLLELLVVLAVMGVMMSVLGFTFLSNSSSDLGDTQRALVSLLQKTKAIAVSTGTEARLIIAADADDTEKYLRHAQIIALDKNHTGDWLLLDSEHYLPKGVWFFSDGVDSQNPDWSEDARCVWSSSKDEEEFRLSLVYNQDREMKLFKQSVDEGAPFFYLKCLPSGNFASASYPQMPKLVFAKGKLVPSAQGEITPTFQDSKQLAGIQIQPFGGILTLDWEDFSDD